MLFAQLKTDKIIPLFFEKAYLHTDREQYAAGEDIWFKAYVMDAKTDTLIDISKNLYVELSGPASNIAQRRVIRLSKGLGHGDFKLADTIVAGQYRIRAYTNWMRNFGDNFVFEKNITIINILPKKAVAIIASRKAKNQTRPTAPTDTSDDGPTVKFMPEGGALINEVCSIVAVKAEDENGKGVSASGVVFGAGANAVAKFACDSLGMGMFTLCPQQAQEYWAHMTIAGKQKNIKLRKPRNMGFNLSTTVTDSTIFAAIATNKLTAMRSAGNNIVITASHSGKTYFKDRMAVTSGDMSLHIPTLHLPEGIACVTVFDERNVPLSERLVYVRHPERNVSIAITTDKPVYQPKEKTTLSLKLCDGSNKPVKANLSLSVVDAGVCALNDENVVTYLNLKSEIKGQIEHVARYSDTANVNRFKQLDLLLLTQGWRDFVWKRIEDTVIKSDHEVEQSIAITGKVRGKWKDKPLSDINITMYAPRATGDKLFAAVTDEAGRFRMDGAVFYGNQFLRFTARQGDGTQGGWVEVDSLSNDYLRVRPLKQNPPDTTSQMPLAARRKKAFSFTGDNILNEVEINTYTNVLPVEIHAITKTEQKDFANMGQYLLYMIPESTADGIQKCPTNPLGVGIPTITHRIEQYDAPIKIRYVCADGSKPDIDCGDDPLGLPMDRYLKATITRRQSVYGVLYGITLTLRPGSLKPKDFFDNTVADINGYYKARVFYTPNYNKPDTRPDYRTTIHWEPHMVTDAKGEAVVSFYNADPKTKVRVIAEGVTDKGVPVFGTMVYEVK